MSDECIILAKGALQTHFAGKSLAGTPYAFPYTIALTGELGAGKTTFLQGFAAALGIETLTSPTYALEQRYETPRGEFIHLDLYRLTEKQADDLLRSSEHFTGIRAIEWCERVSIDRLKRDGHVIHVHCDETDSNDERIIHIHFYDATVPSKKEIDAWRHDVLLPTHIVDHCHAVTLLAERLADAMIAQGRILRKQLVSASAELHDLFRFVDFRDGAGPDITHTEEQLKIWEAKKSTYAGLRHEHACTAFLRDQGFLAAADIIKTHGFTVEPGERVTTEQKLLFYADKRVMLDRVVTLEERFADFSKRYGNGTVSDEAKRWLSEVRAVEKELFPDGPPA